MARRLRCPRCGSTKYWVIQREKRRCSQCRYEWRPSRLPLRLTSRQWREILGWFVRGVSSSLIAHETGLQRQRVLRALTYLRQAILCDVSPELQDGGKAEEIYLVNNKIPRRSRRRAQSARGDNSDSPSPAIVYYGGKICIQVSSNGTAENLVSGAPTEVTNGSVGNGRGRIEKLKGFLGHLKRHLAGKGGIRRKRLPLYLAEHAWRYNHRRSSHKQQIEQLMKLLKKSVYSVVYNGTLPLPENRSETLNKEMAYWSDDQKKN